MARSIKNNKLFAFIAIVFVFQWFACEKPEEEKEATLKITLEAAHKDQAFNTNEIYQTQDNRSYRITQLRMYLSELSLVKSDGGSELIRDIDYIKFDQLAKSNNGLYEITYKTKPGVYAGIKAMYGVPKSLNFSDPNVYPKEHPLSVYQGSHWTWNTGYIFSKLEGRFAYNTNSSEIDEVFLFHPGDTTFYRPFAWPLRTLDLKGGQTTTIRLILQTERFFDDEQIPIDIATEYFTHTAGNFDLADKMARLWTQCWDMR